MPDRIKISTDALNGIANKLDSVQDTMENVKNMLSAVDTSEEAGGDLKSRLSISLTDGTRISGNDVAALVLSFESASRILSNRISTLSNKVLSSAKVFADAEIAISKIIDSTAQSVGDAPFPIAPILLAQKQILDYKKINEPHSQVDDIKNSNPQYGTDERYSVNCQRCIIAYELRRRGYDVEAMPHYTIKKGPFNIDLSPIVLALVSDEVREHYERQQEIYHNWQNFFEDAEWQRVGKKDDSATTRDNIITQMENFGDGARAEVYVAWEGGGAHVFIAENINGEVFFMDPQTGDTNVSDYFQDSRIIEEKTAICRMDNRDLSEYGIECVKNSTGK